MDKPEGKTLGIIAYLTFIGMIIAYFMNKEEKHSFATYHIKNMFGLVILLFASVALQQYLVGAIIYWISVAFWIFSLGMAILNKRKGIPFLSEKFQTWFKFLD
ncbi:MAG: hypothetical protein HKN48_09055 [Flavobacteriaceae bacterium]|nr:hypothetical protein [Flavobacteriaceae bacterium]